MSALMDLPPRRGATVSDRPTHGRTVTRSPGLERLARSPQPGGTQRGTGHEHPPHAQSNCRRHVKGSVKQPEKGCRIPPMGHTRLDPFNQLIRSINLSAAAPTDRKAAIRMALEIRESNLPIDRAATACRGIFAMLQAVIVEAQIQRITPGSTEHRNLTWIHAKHVEVMNKCFAIIGKGAGLKTKNRRAALMQEKSALWHPQGTPSAHEPEVASSHTP